VTNVEYVRRCEALVNDADRAGRLFVQQCRACYYMRGRIGGATVTKSPCRGCDVVLVSGNTCTDRLCRQCATDYDLCRHCGGDMRDRKRRKLVRLT